MKVDFAGAPAYTVVYCILDAGEGVHAERGSMAFMSAGIQVKPALPGGVVRSFIRSRFAEETFVMVHFVSEQPQAWVALAPHFPGDVLVSEVDADGLYVESGCVLAVEDTVETSTRVANLQNVLVHEGATILHVSCPNGGTGKVLFSAYGSIERFELDPDQHLVVDTGFLVAWTPKMQMRVGPLAGFVSSAVTGEGLVAEFVGPGDVYLQTRSHHGQDSWIYPDRQQNTGK